MKKGREILSLPVIATDTGRQLGDVKEIIYDWDEQKILALVLQNGGWIAGSRVVFWEDINNLTDEGVFIEKEDFVRDTKKDEYAKQAYENKDNIFGSKVVTELGEDMGTVEDVILQVPNGYITGYEISEGPVQDLLEGRRFLKLAPSLCWNDDQLVVPSKEVIQ